MKTDNAPNKHSGDIYVLDNEDDTFMVARRWYEEPHTEEVVEILEFCGPDAFLRACRVAKCIADNIDYPTKG